jgi:hypothetical protein
MPTQDNSYAVRIARKREKVIASTYNGKYLSGTGIQKDSSVQTSRVLGNMAFTSLSVSDCAVRVEDPPCCPLRMTFENLSGGDC